MTPDDAETSTRDRRRARLAASLRQNLKRRKAQQRSRTMETGSGAAETRPEAVAEAPRTVAADDTTG
jgi:hypothetical protein